MAACSLIDHRYPISFVITFSTFALKRSTGKGYKEILNNKIWLKIC